MLILCTFAYRAVLWEKRWRFHNDYVHHKLTGSSWKSIGRPGNKANVCHSAKILCTIDAVCCASSNTLATTQIVLGRTLVYNKSTQVKNAWLELAMHTIGETLLRLDDH